MNEKAFQRREQPSILSHVAFISEDEDFFLKNDDAVELARQIFGTLIQS